MNQINQKVLFHPHDGIRMTGWEVAIAEFFISCKAFEALRDFLRDRSIRFCQAD